MNARTFTIFALMVGGVLLVLLVTGGARFVAAQAQPAAPPALTLHVLSAGEISEAERPVQVPAVAVTPGNLGSVTAPAAIAADAENVEFVGHIGGVAYAVFVQGNYAYVGEGPRLTILDISDPTLPTVVGKTPLLPDIVWGIYVSGTYAYVADGGAGLRVVDISDPAVTAEVTHCRFYQGSASGVAMAGGYAYLANGYDGLWVVDMSNPTSPRPCGHNGTLGYARDVVVAGNYAYVADANMGLRVVNISTPCNPVQAGSVDTPGSPHGVAVSGTLAYVADYYGGLRVVDVSDPAHPREVGFYDTPGIAYGVAVAGGYAYVADYSAGLQVVDVSRPVSPTKVGFYATPGYAWGVAVADSYAYVADRDSLQAVDTSIPTAPVKAGSYDAPGSVLDVAVAGRYAYIVGNYRCLNVVNVSTPAMPTEVGSCKTSGSSTCGVAVEGSYAYLADGDLRVVYVHDPAAPQDFVHYPTPGSAHGVVVVWPYAYIADGSSGLQIVDVTTPTYPIRVGFCDTPGHAYDVAIVRPYAYVADEVSGLRVLDISTPTNPACEVGFYDTPGTAYDVAVAGHYAYVADGHAGLQVVDVSNPANPTGVGDYDTLGDARGVAVARDYAYVAGDAAWIGEYVEGGLRVLDVSVPVSPTEVGFYDTWGHAYDVTVAGDYAYVAAEDNGLFILYFAGAGSEPPSNVTISGPATGVAGVAQIFTAVVNPISATRPITYLWQATDKAPVTHTGGRSDTVSFTWSTTGPRTVTVTATNAKGAAIDTHVITIGLPTTIERVTVSGPVAGIVNTAYIFTAMASPITTTRPITYLWQATGKLPVTHMGGLSDTVSFAWDTTGTQVITVTASNAWGSARASHMIVISDSSIDGDAYEPDDACIQASTLTTDGTVQQHTFHDYADTDWVRFMVVSGTTYIIQTTSTGPLADTEIELRDSCTAPPLPAGDLDLGPGTRLRWTASQDGIYYLRVANHNPGDIGLQASYDLYIHSIRTAPGIGAAIVVAGRNGRTLRSNINFAANRAVQVFLGTGLSRDNLYYLNSDSHPGSGLTPDAPATSDNLQHAIETWTADKVGPDQPLYLYLVDHGGSDVFLTDGSGDPTTAADLDRWLHSLETATGCPVNVIVEACRSGSFIDMTGVPTQTVSGAGRVVIASTSATRNAYALPNRGAYFSDSFFTALAGGADLWTAFQAGQQAVAAHHLWQTPWLDDDGDALPHVYDPDDRREARRRGLIGLEYGSIAPYIEWVSGPVEIVDGRGTVRARVVDDIGVDFVWALVYPPSFEEPDPADEETIQLTLDSFVLLDGDGDGEYAGVYGDFTEVGEYRIVVYAKDADGNLALPQAVLVRTGWPVYLPLVMRVH